MNQLLMAMQYATLKLQNRKKGQGVVEYAGALIIAGLIVAAVVATGPDLVGTAFQTIIDNLVSLLNANSGKIVE